MCCNPGKESQFYILQRVPPTLNNLLHELRDINLREDFLTVHYPAVEITACNKLTFLKHEASHSLPDRYSSMSTMSSFRPCSRSANTLKTTVNMYISKKSQQLEPVKSHYFWKVDRAENVHLLHDSFLLTRPLTGDMFGSKDFSSNIYFTKYFFIL